MPLAPCLLFRLPQFLASDMGALQYPQYEVCDMDGLYMFAPTQLGCGCVGLCSLLHSWDTVAALQLAVRTGQRHCTVSAAPHTHPPDWPFVATLRSQVHRSHRAFGSRQELLDYEAALRCAGQLADALEVSWLAWQLCSCGGSRPVYASGSDAVLRRMSLCAGAGAGRSPSHCMSSLHGC